MPIAPSPARSFWLTFLIAALALAGVILAGAALGHFFGLDGSAPSVGKSPFGVGISEGGGSVTGLAGWILSVQSQFSHMMTAALSLLKTDTSALWTLLTVALAYGVFHAAGPGHGKAIIAAYGMAQEKAIGQIITMATAAALLQSLVAIGLVAILSLALHATAATMRETAGMVELASFAAVALLGAGLLWQKSNGLARLIAGPVPSNGHPHDHHHHDHHEHDHHDHDHHHDHHPDEHHVHDEHCGHNHAPIAAPGSGLRGALAAVFAAGIRPCSGSILVLVFALSQGMFAIGISAALAIAVGTAFTTSALAVLAIFAASTATRLAGGVDAPRAVFLARGLEVLAAAFVLALGLALLTGLSQVSGA
jgi:ABC-type nickel/cobalt efflux system permease component RcnA